MQRWSESVGSLKTDLLKEKPMSYRVEKFNPTKGPYTVYENGKPVTFNASEASYNGTIAVVLDKTNKNRWERIETSDPSIVQELFPPLPPAPPASEKNTRKSPKKKLAYDFVCNELEKPEIGGMVGRALNLLISKGATGITMGELYADHRGKSKLGAVPDRYVRKLRDFGAVMTTVSATEEEDTCYILTTPPKPKSTEQRTRESLISMLTKVLKTIGRTEGEDSAESEEETQVRDTKFGKLIRESSNNADFLGGTDTNVQAAMHIFGHAKGGADLRSNGVLGDHNTNHQDEVGVLNFYVHGDRKVIVIEEGYRKGEYTLPALSDPDEEQSQKKWIILRNLYKGIAQSVPEWFWAWVKQVAPEDWKTLWDKNYGK